MNILVTGGAGFIGSHIVDALVARGDMVAVVDDLSTGSRDNVRDGVLLFEVDIADRDAVRTVFDEFAPDAVCHQAAQMSVSRSVREPSFDAEVNILGLVQVLENAVRVGCQRFVFASSGGVLYGDVTTPSPEETPANPISPYGISKWAGEQYLKFFEREHGLKSVALRYSNVYGPRQNPHGEAGVVAIFATKLLAGDAPTINGDGKYVRDYVYVGDVVRANVAALTQELPEPFLPLNVGTAIGTDVNQLAAAMRSTAQQYRSEPLPECTHGPARAGDLRSNLVDPQKIGDVFGWQPQIGLDVGLAETIQWFAQRV